MEESINIKEDEKKAILQQIWETEEAKEKAKIKQQNLIKKLKKMEEKVLVGNQVIEEAKK